MKIIHILSHSSSQRGRVEHETDLLAEENKNKNFTHEYYKRAPMVSIELMKMYYENTKMC